MKKIIYLSMIAAALGAANINTVEGAAATTEVLTESDQLDNEAVNDILSISNLHDAYLKRESLFRFLDYVVTTTGGEVLLRSESRRLCYILNRLPHMKTDSVLDMEDLRYLDWKLFELFYNARQFDIDKYSANKYMVLQPCEFKVEGYPFAPEFGIKYLLSFLAKYEHNSEAEHLLKLLQDQSLKNQIFKNAAFYGEAQEKDMENTRSNIKNLVEQHQHEFNDHLKEKGFLSEETYSQIIERIKGEEEGNTVEPPTAKRPHL